MPLKAIFLGSLGTLAETSELRRRARNSALAEAGLNPSDERRSLSGNSCCSTTRSTKHARRLDAEAVRRREDEIFRDLLGHVRMPPRPGLKGLIDAARVAGLDLALVTTAAPEEVDAMLAVTGFDRSTFSFVGDADTVDTPKPAPDIYLAAMSALSVAPQQVIAIEETLESADAARGLGIRCVSFPGALHVGPRFGVVSDEVRALTPRAIPESRLARLA